jgi:O-antigen/teichoic acid export membrane protein
MVAFYFPVMAGLAAVAKPLVSCLLTDKWLPCVPYLQLLCFTGILYPLHALHLNVLMAQGRSDLFFRLEIIKKAVILIILAATFWMGILAMICGLLVGSIICLTINTYYTRRLIGYAWRRQWGDLVPETLASLAMAAFVWSVSWMPGWNPLSLLISQILLGLAFYGAIVWMLRRSVYADVLSLLSRTWHRQAGQMVTAEGGNQA